MSTPIDNKRVINNVKTHLALINNILSHIYDDVTLIQEEKDNKSIENTNDVNDADTSMLTMTLDDISDAERHDRKYMDNIIDGITKYFTFSYPLSYDNIKLVKDNIVTDVFRLDRITGIEVRVNRTIQNKEGPIEENHEEYFNARLEYLRNRLKNFDINIKSIEGDNSIFTFNKI